MIPGKVVEKRKKLERYIFFENLLFIIYLLYFIKFIKFIIY